MSQEQFKSSKEETSQKGTATSVDRHVGKRLRMRRNSMRIKQADLADQVGITFQQIQKYEYGTNRISAGMLYSLSHALNVDPSYFYEGLPRTTALQPHVSDNQQTGYNTIERTDDPDLILLTQSYKKIKNQPVKQNLLNLVQSMATKD